MLKATRPLPGQTDAPCATIVDRVVVQIDGALGSAVVAGLDCLVVCRCDSPSSGTGPRRPPFRLDELDGAGIAHFGSLPVLVLSVAGRRDPLPVLIFERHQIAAALDGLVVLRRLIASSHAVTGHAEPAA